MQTALRPAILFQSRSLLCNQQSSGNEIFVPFFTTKNEGTGIGLSIARQIMRAHGGNLKVSSIPDKETVFTLVL